MSKSLIDPDSLALLSHMYPQEPVQFCHCLQGEALLHRRALTDAARGLPEHHVERRIHDAGDGENFRLISYGIDTAELLERGAQDEWIMLRFIEQLPRCRALLHRLIAELSPAIGAAENVKGYVFVSPPGTHTPMHFDAEYNVLFQVSGHKTFATYPPSAPWLPLARQEAYHEGGDNMLEWQPGFADQARRHPLEPGEALFVPYCSPHWVRVGTQPSVSLSLTWQSRWSRDVGDALALNPIMRRLGLPAADPCANPRSVGLRALANKVRRRATAGLSLGRRAA